jgi:capsular exopolysaccharide synthesis family protein
MSKFFNETTNIRRTQSAAATANSDIQQMVGSLKQNMESSSPAPAHSAATELNHLLKPLKESYGVALQLAAGRLESCARIRLPRREEKSFLVTQYNPDMQAAVESYRTLRTRLVKQQTKNGTRSLVVSSAAQSEGKTLTTFNLALCYANIQNWPVLAVDADLRTRDLSRLMGEPESPGLAGILEGSCDWASAVRRTDVPRLYMLPAGKAKGSPSELFSGANWKEFVGWASETFRLVIVDSPPALNLSDFELILAPCESTILVVRARTTVRASFAQLLAQIDPTKLAGVVFNAAEEIPNRNYNYQCSGGSK